MEGAFVVAEGHLALLVVHLYGLAVSAAAAAGGAVAHVAHGHVPPWHTAQKLRGKDLSQKPRVLMGGEHPVVVYHYPTALLAPVL